MQKSLIKLYAAGATTSDSVASAIVPIACAAVLISWSFTGITTGTVGASIMFQLAAQSTGQFATNDARNIVDECSFTSDCVTTGVACGTNKVSQISGFRFAAGDKIYLHRFVLVAGFNPCNANVVIQFA